VSVSETLARLQSGRFNALHRFVMPLVTLMKHIPANPCSRALFSEQTGLLAKHCFSDETSRVSALRTFPITH
jgi:hypothetical protein